MRKTKVKLEACQDGDLIAENIYKEGITIPIVTKSTVMNESIRLRLMTYDIDHIYIFKEQQKIPAHDLHQNNFSKKYKNMLRDIKAMYTKISSGENLECEDIVNISHTIITNSTVVYKVIESIYLMKGVDDYTYTHSLNVALYAMLIGKSLKMNEAEIITLIKAGILHDIGKSKIPLEILNKKGKLTEEEFTRIKEHSEIGYQLCNGYTWLSEPVKQAVLMHHERIDGSGYPGRVIDENISKFAKIIAIADVYDALTSERVYKSKQTPFDAFEYMIESGKEIYDMAILYSFYEYISSFFLMSKIRLSNNKIGEIVFINPLSISKPIIKVGSKYYEMSKNPELKILEFL